MNADAQRLIDATDWSALTHAYGEAADVPAIFERVQSPDQKVREGALEDLWSTVWHQGTVYSATASAAHVLATLALDARAYERPQLIMLLSEIARGCGYAQAHGADGMAPGEVEEVLVEEAKEVGAARDAVRQRVPALMRLIADADPGVRAMVPRLAASFPDDAPLLLPTLLGAFDGERDPEVRASILLALGAIGGGDSHLTGLIEERLTAACPECVAAAVAVLWSTQNVTPESAAVFKKAKKRKSAEEAFIERAWGGGLDDVLCWLEETWDGKPGRQGGEA
jgi:hypothetical protein